MKGKTQIYWMEDFLMIILSRKERFFICHWVSLALWHLLRFRLGFTTRYQTALNKCHLWRHGIRRFGFSWFHAYLQWDCRMFVYHENERLIDPRLYETALNVICEDIGSVDFVTRDFMLRCFYLQWDYRVFVYHVYKRLTDPRLYKVDHFCLSLSRALTSCSCFSSVPSWLKDKYYILRADMYLHCFVG